MQKILNEPDRFVDEMLEGILAAHSDRLRSAGEARTLVRADTPVEGKVAIATGGGSGHLPLFLGYIGEGLIDGAAIGGVFSSPSAEEMLAVTKAINGRAGIVYLYGNYGGDVMNFDLASEMAAAEGIDVQTILGADDVASAPPERSSDRRGIAGLVLLYKVAGARAAEGADLADVVAVTKRAAENLRTMGVALSPCILPEAGRPTFELPEGEMEIGMGIHGEPGVRRGSLETADEIGQDLMGAIFGDLQVDSGDEAVVLINGLGATPKEELYILYRTAHRLLRDKNISVHRAMVGEYATSLEMAGASVTVLRLDDELKRLIDAPADSPLFARP